MGHPPNELFWLRISCIGPLRLSGFCKLPRNRTCVFHEAVEENNSVLIKT